jgi:alpha-mannosidase
VELQTDVHNTAKDHRLRVAFPSDSKTDTGYAGQPYDVYSRPIQPEGVNHYDDGTWEPLHGFYPMHDICGIADGDRGVTIAGDGLMEYEIMPMRNNVTLTLLRATDRLHVGVMGAGSKFKIHEAQLLGKQSFRYAFFPSAEGFAPVMPAVECFRHPLVPVQKDFLEAECMPDYVPAPVNVPACAGFIHVDGDVVNTCLKPAENGDGMILRFYNPVAEAKNVTVSLDPMWHLAGVNQVRMDETMDAPFALNGDAFSVTVPGKKIMTYRIHAEIK